MYRSYGNHDLRFIKIYKDNMTTTIEQAIKQLNEQDAFKGYIYKITNNIDGKFYIGKTHYAVDKRIYAHMWVSDNRNDTNSKIHSAIRKYGKENFTVEIIDEARSEKELNEKEIYWIKALNAQDSAVGYNIAKGGEGGIGGPMFAGHKHSEETKAKMSINRRGENNANYGNHRIMPQEEKIKHGQPGDTNGMWGKHHSEESKYKSRLSHIGKKAYSNLKSNKVIMLTPEEGEKLMLKDPDWFEGNIHAKNYINNK